MTITNDIESNNKNNNGQFVPMYDKGTEFPSFSNNFQPLKVEDNQNEDFSNKTSILLFLLGFLLLIPWIVNVVINFKSENKIARAFSIASLVLFCLAIIVIILISIILIVMVEYFHKSHREDS
ncbi:hypothetical protein RB653_005693 [Dictyostelium firmibasis]|uniref:Transmembrane protein n=1 Tax=Dictyostelium firmibasis TaxID=79012 RepID=A0AAN7YYE6_9MYCE